MEQPVFRLPFITEGATEKVSQFVIQPKSIYSKKVPLQALFRTMPKHVDTLSIF